ncbi:XRE family transcriptional regulator [Candidatus Parcubacteria bacterium]|nr:XRE family transcriptional regulator [Candidatus Parcubacteria bacterium]
MNTKQLNKFLVKAKINTYASGGEKQEEKLSDGSKELEFEEKEFKYRDRYFGYNSFIGEEIVWQNEKTVWGMNYCGEIVSEIISAKQIYQFLKEALKKVTEDKPFRGPDNFKENDFEYVNKIRGMVKKFEGRETIFYKGKSVYELSYYGGMIIKKL